MPINYAEYLKSLNKRLEELEEQVHEIHDHVNEETDTEEILKGIIILSQIQFYREIKEKLIIQSN